MSPHHSHTILVLYRMLLRHLQALPDPLLALARDVVCTQFRAHRAQAGRPLQQSVLRGYEMEKLLFQYHTGTIGVVPIREAIEKHQLVPVEDKFSVSLKKKPSILDSYPPRDPQRVQFMQREQRLERLITKLVILDQLKGKIPRKSPLDANYVRQIYGRKVIHMKASQYFRRLLKMYGPNSEPYEPKYIYNSSDRVPLLTLRLPVGSIREIDQSLAHQVHRHVDYVEGNLTLAAYRQEFERWLTMEDQWEAQMAKIAAFPPAKVKFVDMFSMAERQISSENLARLENEVKLHNRRVMLLKSQVKPHLQRYHEVQRDNFAKLLQFIEDNHVNEYNEYNQSLDTILKKHGFDNGLRFNVEEFGEKLDAGEFEWTVAKLA